MEENSSLKELLHEVKGKVLPNYKIGNLTFFKAGGCADYFFVPQDLEDLRFFLKNKPQDVPIFLLGAGSNILIREGGIRGVVIKLLNFTNIFINADSLRIKAQAGALDKLVASEAAKLGILGLEFLFTIPGTIGGATYMNAGAHAQEIADIFVSAELVTAEGEVKTRSKEELAFSYRSSSLGREYASEILTSVTLQGKGVAEPIEILNRMNDLEDLRRKTQPLAKDRTAGSTFKNPKGTSKKAWQLIKEAGCCNLTVGGAAVSAKHCNFIINTGTATAKDIESLGNLIRETVKNKFNINLEWEVKIVGEL